MNALCFLFGHKIKDLYPIKDLGHNRLLNKATCERCRGELMITTQEIIYSYPDPWGCRWSCKNVDKKCCIISTQEYNDCGSYSERDERVLLKKVED